MALLKDHQFNENCKLLKIIGLHPNDPDKKTIEKAFRRVALKTHPDKGGDPIEFKKINEAYNKLIGHVTKRDAIEAEAELSRTSVIIEISKQAVPKWKEKLKGAYGPPKPQARVKSVLFNGPFCHHSGKGRLTGPIVVMLYEDPEDKIPKIVCQCDNYMAWMQEQKMPLHLHVGREKNIMFDQWRIMSLAEFGFVSLTPGNSARHDYQDSNRQANYKSDKERQKEEKERKEREAQEEAARKVAAEKKKAEEEEAARVAEEEKKKDEELSKLHQPWWQKYAEKYQGSAFEMGETTPPPEDDSFPQVYSMTSNSYTSAPAPAPTPVTNPAKLVPNYFASDKQSTPGAAAEKLSKSSEEPSSTTEKISKAERTPAPASTCSTKDLNSAEKQPSASPVVDEPVPAPSKKVQKEPVVAAPETEKKPVPAPAPAAPIPAAAIPVPAPTAAPAAPIPVPAPVSKPEPSIAPKKEPEIQKAPKPYINGEAPAAKTPAAKTPEPSTSNDQQLPEDQPKAKKPLSNIAEKMLSKSKIKKVKTKKATVKKAKPSATNSEDIIDNEEKENVDSSRRTSESNDASSVANNANKMDSPNPVRKIDSSDIKPISTRKRPLEDIDVEGRKRSLENILHQMEQRNNEIMESVMDMKAAMADTCSKIHTLSL